MSLTSRRRGTLVVARNSINIISLPLLTWIDFTIQCFKPKKKKEIISLKLEFAEQSLFGIRSRSVDIEAVQNHARSSKKHRLF